MAGLNGPALQGVDVFGLSHVCTTAGFIDSTNPEGVCVCVCLCIACAVSAMLSEVVGCGGGGDLEFDVVLGQEELTEKSLQLTHLLSPGFIPVSLTQTHTRASYYDVYNHVDASSDSYSHLARPSVSKKLIYFSYILQISLSRFQSISRSPSVPFIILSKCLVSRSRVLQWRE